MRTRSRAKRKPTTRRFSHQVRGRGVKRAFVLDRVINNKAEAEGRASGWRRMGYLARVTKQGQRQYAIWVVRR